MTVQITTPEPEAIKEATDLADDISDQSMAMLCQSLGVSPVSACQIMLQSYLRILHVCSGKSAYKLPLALSREMQALSTGDKRLIAKRQSESSKVFYDLCVMFEARVEADRAGGGLQ